MAVQILIADEQASNRILLKARLAAAHYDVAVADGADGVLALARRGMPDLALIGIGTPPERDFGLIAALRADPRTSGIGILALVAGRDPSLRCGALAAGADDVISRRDGPDPLLARIRAMLRARNRDADLGLRDETCLAFGFAESQAAFEPAGRVAIAAHRPETAAAWRAALAPQLRDRVEVVSTGDLIDAASGRTPPDVVLVETDLAGRRDSLGAIAELRSRADSRTMGIVVVLSEGDDEGMARALDLGADDAVCHPVAPAELVLRLRAQLRRKAQADRVRRQVSDGLRLAVTDPLTGLYNRRYALAQLARIGAQSAATGRPFAVMVIDLDRFKQVNDSHGHAAGDAALVEVARRLSGGLRGEDLVARLGGEEFLVAMPDTGEVAAAAAAERLRRLIEEAAFAIGPAAAPLRLTVSIGVAVGGGAALASEGAARPDDPRRPGVAVALAVEALMGLADRALYSAKAGGRNHVIMSRPAA